MRSTARSILLTTCLFAAACSGGDYTFDTVEFAIVASGASATGPTPNVFIDTNVEVSGLFGGSVKSERPYDIQLSLADESFTFARLELTHVSATAADGTNDPGAAALVLPVRFEGRELETTNSVAGGRVVTSKVRLISGELVGVITRDVAMTLRLEGRIVADDGSATPFAMEQKFDVLTDTSTKPWADVMSDS
jgi:hypothetical protein